MFDKSKEGKFESERSEAIKAILEENKVLAKDAEKRCIDVDDVKRTIRASFQFIKDNPIVENGKLLYAYLTMKVFLTADVSSTINDFDYAITELEGAVKEVKESYVVLVAVNSHGQEFEIKVAYEDIVYFWHGTIYRNFEKYVNFINAIPPVCKDLGSESYNLLVKLAKILGKNDQYERDFVFILGKVLTRRLAAKGISIVRNLVVVDELFINPITSIQGFSQPPNTK